MKRYAHVPNFPSTTTIATKTSLQEKEALQAIAERGGITMCDMLRQVILNIIRHGDTSHPLTVEQKHLFSLFDKRKNNPKRSAPKVGNNGAIYFYYDKSKGQQAYYFDGENECTQNIETILHQVLHKCSPTLLQRIMHQAKTLGNNSILLTLSELLARVETLESSEYIQTLFSGNTYDEKGKEVAQYIKYIPKNDTYPQKMIMKKP